MMKLRSAAPAAAIALALLACASYGHAAPAKDATYGAIDGKHLWGYVAEQADIARRYRDSGHPQFWGRLAGTSADVEDAAWLQNKFKQIGLETRLQTVNFFAPQWAAESWSVAAVGGAKSIPIASAEPAYASPGTDGKELDLEVAYVGLGSEADFANRDVRGKAVLLVKAPSTYQAGSADLLKRAEDHGAAAILSMDLRGGNYNVQSYRAYTKVPTFNLGTKDGEAIRDLIAVPGAAPHIKIRLDAKWLPDQKSYLVWGTLPGATNETIYVIAHRDGFFDAAGDNASGVATMLGLAEHFAKIPKSQRRRTMVFLGTDGHHQIKPGGFGREWLVANRDKFFSKTALMINAEHPAEVMTHGGTAGTTTAGVPLEWYAGGRPRLQKIAAEAFRQFGVPIWAEPGVRPPGGDLGRFYWFVPGVVAQSNDFANMHTANDSPDVVSPSGLEAVTRAYAKIIDDVNRIALKDLQLPATADPNAPGTPQGYISLAHCEAWIGDSTKACVQP
ncbi:MAG: M28 family peptidase [Alphaproteobacteria bacterium]|nr:M28 family peptidase [Alphaproteobacteria bacterium]